MDTTSDKILFFFLFICSVELGVYFTLCLILFVAKTPALAQEEQQVGQSSEAVSGTRPSRLAEFPASVLGLWHRK